MEASGLGAGVQELAEGSVIISEVVADPQHQKPEHVGGDEVPAFHGGCEVRQLVDELPVLQNVALPLWIMVQRHQPFFPQEMPPGIVGKLAQDARHQIGMGAVPDDRLQFVDQADQKAVIVVDHQPVDGEVICPCDEIGVGVAHPMQSFN